VKDKFSAKQKFAPTVSGTEEGRISIVTGTSTSSQLDAEDIDKFDSTVESAGNLDVQLSMSDAEGKIIAEQPAANMLTEFGNALEGDWTLVQSQLPEDWMWDVEYQSGCWSCTPLEPDTPKHYPLTIASAPVVLPVEYQWPPIGGVNPPPDPRPSAPIDPWNELSLDTVRDLFLTFEGSVGFYVLISGLLQIYRF
jgi:hypothetical protein